MHETFLGIAREADRSKCGLLLDERIEAVLNKWGRGFYTAENRVAIRLGKSTFQILGSL